MRKLKLLMAACALLGASAVQAQTWTPSEVGEGSFYLYNVGAQGYLVAGNNWGTRASINPLGGILVELKAADGKYEISTAPSFSGSHLGFNGYVDNGDKDQNWTFELDDVSGAYKLSTGSAYLFADEGATTTTVGDDPSTDYSLWKLVTRANRIADLEANASKDNPMDATFLLTNPNFDRNCNTGVWSGGVSLGGNNENQCAEKFNTTFDVNQTVTDAPKGAYALAFQGFYRYGGHGIDPAGNARANGTEELNTKLYANDTEAPLMSILDETTAGGSSTYNDVAYPNNMSEASTAFSNGLYSTSMDFTVDASTIKIGVKKTVAVTNDWTIFDNARLTYYGPVVDFTIYEQNLATAVSNAEALYDNLPSAAKTALEDIVTTNNNSYSSVDDYVAAISAIKGTTEAAEPLATAYQAVKAINTDELPAAMQSSIESAISDADNADYSSVNAFSDQTTVLNVFVNNAKSVADAYKNFNTVLELAEGLLMVDSDNPSAKSDLESAISTFSVEDETTAEAINEKTASLKEAAATYANAANPVGEDAKFDISFMLTNPDVTSYWTGAWGVQPDGWYNEQSGGNFQVMANEDMGPGGEIFMEYWSEKAASNGFVLCQKITLPEGTYRMSGRTGVLQYDGNGTTANVTLSANDVDGTKIPFGSLSDSEVEFVQESEGEVKIGLKAQEGNNARWMGINKIQLFKVPANTIDLDEETAYEPESKAGTVTLKKTIQSGWNTVVLPFGVTADQIASEFGDGTLYKYTGDDEKGVLNFEEATAIEPHTPYLFKSTGSAKSEMEFAGVTISTGTPATAGTNFNFVGTYEPITSITANDYVLGESAFVKAAGGNSLKAFRAYIQGIEESAARELLISINGEVTAIETIDGKNLNNNAAIYNLAGQQVKNAQKGVFIQNGKKVIVK